jgi:hypothetical protein
MLTFEMLLFNSNRATEMVITVCFEDIAVVTLTHALLVDPNLLQARPIVGQCALARNSLRI